MGHRTTGIFIAAAALAWPHCALASDDQQVWLTAASTISLNDSVKVSQETILRFGNDRGGLYEIETNLLLGTRVSRHLGIWAGYTHDLLYNGGRFARLERRGRQQITLDDLAKLGPGTLSLRFRLEERWRDGQQGTAWRARPFVRFQIPLGTRRKWGALVLSHESFVAFNRTGFQAQVGEDRMRNLVVLRVPVLPHVQAEAGYMNQYLFVRGGEDHVDHAASLGLNFTF